MRISDWSSDVCSSDLCQVLARRALAGRGELRRGPQRRRLRRLAACVGIDLRVQHQDIDIAILGQHMVQAAGADVVGPPVAAYEPELGSASCRERVCQYV